MLKSPPHCRHAGRDLTGLDMETRGLPNAVEQRGFGGRHPHLAAPFEPGEQGRAPARIEMGGDLVEQQDRRRAAAFRDQLGMGEDKPEQQRLLLAGRGSGGRHVLGAMGDGEVLPMRADGRPAGGGVAAAAGLESRRRGRLPSQPSSASVALAKSLAGVLGEPLVQRGDRARRAPRATAAPCSAMPASSAASQAGSALSGSASNLLRARIAAS